MDFEDVIGFVLVIFFIILLVYLYRYFTQVPLVLYTLPNFNGQAVNVAYNVEYPINTPGQGPEQKLLYQSLIADPHSQLKFCVNHNGKTLECIIPGTTVNNLADRAFEQTIENGIKQGVFKPGYADDVTYVSVLKA